MEVKGLFSVAVKQGYRVKDTSFQILDEHSSTPKANLQPL